jgi:hypothetical protein
MRRFANALSAVAAVPADEGGHHGAGRGMEGDAVVVSEREGYLGKRWLTDLSRALTAPDP